MAGIPLKSGADFYNLEASRMRLHNLGADPTEVGTGLIYFNTSTGMNTSGRARIYTGNGFKSLAFLEDVDGRIKTIEDMLNVDTAEGVVSTWNEIQAFLDSVQEGTDLMDLLNSKLSTSGGTISGSLQIGNDDNISTVQLQTVRRGHFASFRNTVTEMILSFGEISAVEKMLAMGDSGLRYSADGGSTYNDILTSAGGTIISDAYSPLVIKRSANAGVVINFENSRGFLGSIGVYDNGAVFVDSTATHTLLHSGNYSDYALPLSGGTISIISDEGISINRTNGTRAVLSFKVDGGYKGGLGIDTDGVPFYRTHTGGIHTLLHSGNIGEYKSGDSDKLGGVEAARYFSRFANIDAVDDDANTLNGFGFYRVSSASGGIGNYPDKYGYIANFYNTASARAGFQLYASSVGDFYFRRNWETWQSWKAIAFTDSNVASAQALVHSNGTVGATVDEYGGLCLTTRGLRTDGGLSLFDFDGTQLSIGYSMRNSYLTDIYGNTIRFMVGDAIKMLINSSGNVTIGAEDKALGTSKLYINGRVSLFESLNFTRESWNYITVPSTSGNLAFNIGEAGTTNTKMCILNSGNVGIGTTNPTEKLHVVGNLYVTGNIIADGEVSAGGAAEESGEGGGGTGGGVEPYVFTFTPSTTTVSVNHNISSEDVIVQVFEKDATSGKWNVILVDIEIVDSTRVDLHFGRTETTEHKVVIIG